VSVPLLARRVLRSIAYVLLLVIHTPIGRRCDDYNCLPSRWKRHCHKRGCRAGVNAAGESTPLAGRAFAKDRRNPAVRKRSSSQRRRREWSADVSPHFLPGHTLASAIAKESDRGQSVVQRANSFT
jgi:hypothetical protein